MMRGEFFRCTAAGCFERQDHGDRSGMYYARVVFETNGSAAEIHADFSSAQQWIEEVRVESPGLFRQGQIREAGSTDDVVATCDLNGWQSSTL